MRSPQIVLIIGSFLALTICLQCCKNPCGEILECTLTQKKDCKKHGFCPIP